MILNRAGMDVLDFDTEAGMEAVLRRNDGRLPERPSMVFHSRTIMRSGRSATVW